MRRVLLLFFFITLFSYAEAVEIVAGHLIETQSMDPRPSYFFSVNPSGDRVAFTDYSSSISNATKIFDFKTQKISSGPGYADPVFVNDRLLVVSNQGGGSYSFFKVEDLIRDELQAQALVVDAELNGTYQSVGILKSTPDETHFRVLITTGNYTTREAELMIREYVEKYDATGTLSLQPIESKKVCTNHWVKLPMISNDGQRLGGMLVDEKTSAILNIADDGTCSIEAEFGMYTGKISFSSDNHWAAYHKDHSGSPTWAENWINYPSNGYVMDVFVYSLKTQKHYQISKVTGSNAMYPRFTENGELIFVDLPHPENKSDKVSFIKVDLKDLEN